MDDLEIIEEWAWRFRRYLLEDPVTAQELGYSAGLSSHQIAYAHTFLKKKLKSLAKIRQAKRGVS